MRKAVAIVCCLTVLLTPMFALAEEPRMITPFTSRVLSVQSTGGNSTHVFEIKDSAGTRAVFTVVNHRTDDTRIITDQGSVGIDYFRGASTTPFSHKTLAITNTATRVGAQMRVRTTIQRNDEQPQTSERMVNPADVRSMSQQSFGQMLQMAQNQAASNKQGMQITGECGAIYAICLTYALLFIECWPCYMAFWLECMMQSGCW